VMQSLSANPHANVRHVHQAHAVPNTFHFNAFLAPYHLHYNRVHRSGLGNELARHIALVQVEYIPRSHITITITTHCDVPTVLEGSICARYKRVSVNGITNHD